MRETFSSESGDAMPPETLAATATATDTFPINGTDFIEFYVGNAKQAATTTARPSASTSWPTAGPRQAPAIGRATSSSRTRFASSSRLALTARPAPIAAHVHQHGDGVRDIALWVDDARDAFRQGDRARRRGRRRSRRFSGDERRRSRRSPESRPTATRFIAWSSAGTTRARSCPASSPCPPDSGPSPSASSTSTTASATSSSGG